ncbi:MAG: hypothetical protein Q9216_005641, partial [Gyalolechia sp. 2 TL-2023]
MAARSPQSMKVPPNRFNLNAFYHSHNERPGSFNVPGGYFLEGDPADFDPSFFGITPVEATWMDPQQRKLLETIYEAMESSVLWKDWHIQPVLEPRGFPVSLPCRRVSVNASGYGGTNAHAIIENFQTRDQSLRAYKSLHKWSVPDSLFTQPRRPHLLVFSAHDKTTLIQNIGGYSEMRCHPKLVDLSYTLAERRSLFALRAYAICRQDSIKPDLQGALRTIRQTGNPPTIAFAFTGQGAQWPRMGSRLFEAFPSYTQTIRELDQVLATIADPPSWSIEACLSDIDSTFSINDAEIAQPVCTAVQIGLVRLLAQWNIFPVVTIGHSSGKSLGEIAAAFTAGYLSAEDAIRIAFYRGKVVAAANANGAMLAVSLGAVEVLPYLGGYQDRVVVACHNSPNSVTLSGDADAIDELKAYFDSSKIFARVVRTGGKAYHSHHMITAAMEYRNLLINADLCDVSKQQNPKRKRCHMISTVSNNFMDDDGMDSAYWALNLESPVLFNQAVLKLTETMPKLDMIVEIGPHPALSGPIRQITADTDRVLSYMPTLKRGENDIDQLLSLAGELWASSSMIDIGAVTSIEHSLPSGHTEKEPGSLLVDLPKYQWNYSKKYYSEPRQSREHRGCKHPRHDLLGRSLPGLSPGEPQWRNVLRLGDMPWLKDHTLGNEVVFPAAGYFAMAIEATTQVNMDSADPLAIHSFTLRGVSIKTALVVPSDDNGVETLVVLHRSNNGPAFSARHSSRQWYTFSVSSISMEDDTWKEHATGVIGVNKGPKNQAPKQDLVLPLHASGKSWYRCLNQVGFNYGPTFQNMIKVHMDHKLRAASCAARIRVESGLMQGESSYNIHPGTVDCCLQSIIVSIYAGKLSSVTHGFVPIGIDSITLWTTPIKDQEESSKINTRVYDGNNRHFSADSQLISSEGKMILDLQGVHCVAYEAAVPQKMQKSQPKFPYSRLRWMPDLGLTPISRALMALAESSVMDVLTLLRHNNVSTKILDIDGGLAPELIKRNVQVKITVSVSSDELLQNKQAAFEDHPFVQLVELDITNEQFESFFDTVYDLIAVPEVTRKESNLLSSSLLSSYSPSDRSIRWSLLREAQAEPEDQVIILEDLDEGILCDLQEDELKSLRYLAQATTHILWITTGGLLSGRKPEHAMVSGLARCLRSENASLDLITVDIDAASATTEQMIETIAIFAGKQAETESRLEAEYLVDGDVVYISRLAPLTETADSSTPLEDQVEFSTLDDDSKLIATVHSGKLYFQEQDETVQPLESDQAEVRVMAVGINHAHTSDVARPGYGSISSCEIGGIVTAVGSKVSHLKVGDRVVGFSSNDFSTSQRTLAELLCPTEENDAFEAMVSLPLAFSTAIHGLQELAHVEEEETVLILDNTGAAGFAAVQVCRGVKARFIFVTEKEDVYVSLHETGFSDDQIILCKDDNIVEEIQRCTKGLAVDIILSQSTVDGLLLQDCAVKLAPFARIILVGEGTSSFSGLDTLPNSSKLSVFRFDVFDICQRKPKTAARLLRKCVQWHKDGKISNALPVHSSSISEIDDVVSQFSNSIVSDNAIVSYGDRPIVKTLPSQVSLRFDPNAVYLLIGCLGGLGRSLTSWMVDRGVKNLAFMARSGADRPAAAHLVSTIEARGVEVTVLRGDVADSKDVKTAIQTITKHHQLRGVVNAAMVLNDGLFQSMDPTSWRNTVDPKVKGSFNLHEAVKELELDFFVLLSSTSGIIGTPSQSNYAAGNTYQDALALHRRATGLPAVSLILPMILGVGYVADNPEIEDSLLRKGIYGIHEDELLAGFEAAMTPQRKGISNTHDDSPPADAHIILGFEPSKLAHSVAQPETTDAFWLSDPRFSHIVSMMQSSVSSTSSASNNGTSNANNSVSDIRAKHKSSPEDAMAAIRNSICHRLARLLSLDPEDVRPEEGDGRSVASYGLDSMIGTEFRSWLFREFGADVSYQRLLAPGLAGELFTG